MTNYDAMAEKIGPVICSLFNITPKSRQDADNYDAVIKEIAAALREAASGQEQWLCARLLEAIKQKKPAITAFTEGPLRQVMYAVEERLREAVEEAKTEVAEAAAEFCWDKENREKLLSLVNATRSDYLKMARSEALEQAAKICDDLARDDCSAAYAAKMIRARTGEK